MSAGVSRTLEIDGRRILFTEPDEPLGSEPVITRADLLSHYLGIADELLPFLSARPVGVLRRTEQGINDTVFLKTAPPGLPAWIPRAPCRDELSTATLGCLVISERAALAHLVNIGALSFHTWGARREAPQHPDLMLFDVDPNEIAFREVRHAAMLVRDLLGRYGVRSWVKTSGGRGLHVFVPLAPVHTFEEVRAAASLISRAARSREPKLFTFEIRRSRRRGRILLDVDRNRAGATLISPYSVRLDRGLVSTPLAWAELERAMYPEDFPLAGVGARLAAAGNPLRGLLDQPQSIEPLLDLVRARSRRQSA